VCVSSRFTGAFSFKHRSARMCVCTCLHMVCPGLLSCKTHEETSCCTAFAMHRMRRVWYSQQQISPAFNIQLQAEGASINSKHQSHKRNYLSINVPLPCCARLAASTKRRCVCDRNKWHEAATDCGPQCHTCTQEKTCACSICRGSFLLGFASLHP